MAAAPVLAASETFDEFLANEKAKDLLRFTTAGSVDDGKSTLIGRLLFDSRSVYEDQLESVTKASAGRNAGSIDFSLLTDGLRAEREQGITIDVAYRYFATPKRKFIIADTPGHEQYTRNMVTGASTAELAIILVDARKGVLQQSRRHTFIASLLGLPQVVIAVNKMDLVGYDQAVFARIETEFRRFLSRFQSIEPYFIPISALAGDNVVTASSNMPWFRGESLLGHLENVPVGDRAQHSAFRFAVQRVVRPNQEFRGYAGTVASGEIHRGDTVTIFPARRPTTIESISTFDGNLETARFGQSVTLTLAEEIDIGRGDVIAAGAPLPQTSNSFDATVVWLNEIPLELNRRYRLKHASRQESAELKFIHHRVNINTLDREPAQTLEMNAIGLVRVETARPISFDSYVQNRMTGSFILIDAVSNATLAAGMITGSAVSSAPTSRAPVTREVRKTGRVSAGERVARSGHTAAIISLGGRAEVAWRLERMLFDRGCSAINVESFQIEAESILLKAGLLVIATGSARTGFYIQTLEGTTDTSVESLPDSDAEAAETIQRLLEKLQVLLPAPGWSESGGI